MQACTACMVMSLLTTCMHFNTPPLAQIAPFDARFASQTRKYRSTCQLILVCTTQSLLERLVDCILTIPVCRSGLLLGSKSCSPSEATTVFTNVRTVCYSCFAHCPCFAHCCHDQFIVRSASYLSTVSWFHSVCASVSMFTINTDNCLVLFLFLC